MAWKQPIPKILVGRYAGTPIDQLPMSYLRWMLTQDFPKAWLEIADKKVKASHQTQGGYIEISRHAIDNFSLRFIHLWMDKEDAFPPKVGLASFIAVMAQEAWEKGQDVSKHRHQNDGIVRLYNGVKWVFGINPNYPDYKEVITVM